MQIFCNTTSFAFVYLFDLKKKNFIQRVVTGRLIPSPMLAPPTDRLRATAQPVRPPCSSDSPRPGCRRLPNSGVGQGEPSRSPNGTEPGVSRRSGRRHERPVPPGCPGRIPERAEGGHSEGAERAGRGWDDTDPVGRLPRPSGGAAAHRRQRVSPGRGLLGSRTGSEHPSVVSSFLHLKVDFRR